MIDATMPNGADGQREQQTGLASLDSALIERRRRRGRSGAMIDAGVALEQVGAHAGDVADVVAHVVGDGGRVAGVVLGDAGLDLADEVGADVGGLGVDAAADAGEQRDRRGAEPEGGDDLEGSSTSSTSTKTM